MHLALIVLGVLSGAAGAVYLGYILWPKSSRLDRYDKTKRLMPRKSHKTALSYEEWESTQPVILSKLSDADPDATLPLPKE